ncbi:glutamate 5-kinase [Methanohalophilus sp.]|uniref:glutamate 5-kinase n=1 Tax=Methanohalophilus sp. TaxID=1966352 RepID=UPI0026170919|nr:glutamate 5-kinase [Methanohalophilus sp.]MDK2892676.1 glutamate 5-kinase [Methanohalophilus sp.]
MTDRKELLGDVQKIVVKIGTTSISREDGSLDTDFMEQVASQVSRLHKEGRQVILVSSGSIGTGIEILGLNSRPREIPMRQAAAAVGQSILMQKWMEAFRIYGLNVAQILLTYESFTNRLTYLNLRNSISALLDFGVIPIINENDPTCVHEIEATLGDNDKLSAMVASKIEADLLIILSDIDGLYDKNPKRNPNAKLLKTVEKITPTIESYGGSPTSTKGIGGMRTKIEAAKICNLSGCHMIIANSQVKDVILNIIYGQDIGTLFVADKEVHSNRIRWILLARSAGKIIVDEGACNALQNRMSLLPSGVIDIVGNFDRGDIVEIDCNGKIFAKGITDYTSDELQKIKGKHTNMIADILGYKNYDHVVKKENIALIQS